MPWRARAGRGREPRQQLPALSLLRRQRPVKAPGKKMSQVQWSRRGPWRGGQRGRWHADGDSARAPGSAEKAKDPGRARGAASNEAARNTERTLPRARANDGAGVAGGGQTAGAAELPGGVAPNSECGVAAEAATPRSEPPLGQQRLKGGCTGPEVPSRARRRSPAQPAARRLKQRQGRRPQAMYLGKGCI